MAPISKTIVAKTGPSGKAALSKSMYRTAQEPNARAAKISQH